MYAVSVFFGSIAMELTRPSNGPMLLHTPVLANELDVLRIEKRNARIVRRNMVLRPLGSMASGLLRYGDCSGENVSLIYDTPSGKSRRDNQRLPDSSGVDRGARKVRQARVCG